MNARNALLLCGVLVFALPAMAKDDSGKVDVPVNFSFVRRNPPRNYLIQSIFLTTAGSLNYFFTQYIGFEGELTGYASQNETITVLDMGNLTAKGDRSAHLFGLDIKKRKGSVL